MKVTSGALDTHFGVRLLRNSVLVLIVLGIAFTLLLAAGPAAADGPHDLLVPIVLEEGRTPPKVVDPPSVPEPPKVRTNVPIILEETRDAPKRVQRQVQGNGASITQQNSTTLVSNTEQATGSDLAVSADVAQPFTTGSEAGGYRLTGVQLFLGLISGTAPGFSVSIHEDSSSGLPGSSLGALTMVGSLSNTASLVQFTASGIGISLDAGTTYWVVLDTDPQPANTDFVTKLTSSKAEDTAAAGWSIGDLRRWRTLSANEWPAGNTNLSTIHPIIIQGHAKKDTILPANFDCNAYLGWEHTNGRQWDSADRVWRQVGSYYYTGQYANTGEPICERRFSSAGPGTYAEKLGYGMTLCSQAPTWQTVDPETGEAVGGPDRVHKTGHLTSSGQEICSDFDGLRSTKKYRQEQQLKQLCSREPTHALCN